MVRRARLVAEGDTLTYHDEHGGTRCWRTGACGEVVDAVHVDVAAIDHDAPGTGAGEVLGDGPLGFVDLRARDFTSVVRIPLGAWTPEAADGPDPAAALRLSGLVAATALLGLPLRRVHRLSDDAVDPMLRDIAEGRESERTVRLSPGHRLGGWWTGARVAASLVTAVALLSGIALRGAAPVLVLIAALALAGTGALDLSAHLAGVLRDRRSARALPTQAVLRPSPGGPAPRGFLRKALLRAEPEDLVVVDQTGSERWLPRSGPERVAGIAVVSSGDGPRWVELRTEDGSCRAALPWDAWFAGPGGGAALSAWAAHSALPVDRDALDLSRGGELPWTFRPLTRDQVLVRRLLRPALPPPGTRPQLVALSALTLLVAAIGRTPAPAAAATAGTVLVAALGSSAVSGWRVRWNVRAVTPVPDDRTARGPAA